MSKNSAPALPDWERVLSAAARLQRTLPDAVLVGGTAAAIYAGHRFSRAADPVITDLRQRFDRVLVDLESVAGWKTARVQRPVQILGKLDGIETGVRQLVREEPLETTVIERLGAQITIPSESEILRIKGVLGRVINCLPCALPSCGDGCAKHGLPIAELLASRATKQTPRRRVARLRQVIDDTP